MKEIKVPRVIEGNQASESVVVYNIDDFPYDDISNKKYKIVGRANKKYYNVSAAFDIETTTIDKRPDKDPYGFMYHWQFCIDGYVCFGRTWQEYMKFTCELEECLNLVDVRLCVFVHFLGFEFQFMHNFFVWDKIFATEKRAVVTAITGGIEYRCSYRLSNMPLQKFCETSKLCTYYKMDGEDYNYKKIRTAADMMSDNELAYCYNDVRGLCECIDTLLLDDTIATLPLTSTGYCRRDARKATKENPDNIELMKDISLTPYLYAMCKSTSRGGNTHASMRYSTNILEDVYSVDIKSSYPYVMLAGQFPMTRFRACNGYKLDEYAQEYACLIDITLEDIKIKSLDGVAYIPKAKCLLTANPRTDNGRILSAKRIRIMITDIDYNIINKQYNFIVSKVHHLFCAEYGYLPYEFRRDLSEKFKIKCELETGDKYLLAKFKNKINAYFGMILTDICHSEYEYVAGSDEPWRETPVNPAKALNDYYNSRNSFLSYQHGIWVTANARKRLQEGIDIAGRDFVYCDTDSVKSLRDISPELNEINQKVIDSESKCGVSIHGYGKDGLTYCGLWCDDGHYRRFVTLGAKKYAYEDEKGKLSITVSGLDKKKGAEWFEKHGGIEAFRPFLENEHIGAENSGRTVAYYNDVSEPYWICVNGCKMLTASNVGVVDTTYTLGIAPEYAIILNSIQKN